MKLTAPKTRILVIALGILFILSLNFFNKEVKGFFYFISAPMQNFLWETGDSFADSLTAIFRSKDLKRENERLRVELHETMAKLSSLEDFKKENQILRESLNIGLQKEFKLIIAEVTGKDAADDYLILNKGLRDGVSKDMPVITQQKVLLGKVVEVYEKFSRVLLITNKKSSFDAKVADKNIAGVAAGSGGLKLTLEFVPQNEDIKEGDLVASSSLGGIYPQGLLAGLVKKAEKSDIQPFQQIEISPFFDIGELDELFIISD